MTKEELIQKVADLYIHTSKSTVDTELFKSIVDRIHVMYDTYGWLNLLDNKNRQLKMLSDALPVSELAKICGLSRRHTHRLLKDNSKLDIFYKYVT